ncbi:hypothetical protein POM88_023018 [Heracleum sosnowskyi]|uniref:Uncharacterized protein n=1 Tax=Heracleum sosnowskyi TaxID=360622 RepID=A0AAD8IHJ0_9APIA|nr:hypothetical protein POM88_023018 [Heracleum sosnowskyi]
MKIQHQKEKKVTDSDKLKNFLAQFRLYKEVERDKATKALVDSLEEKTAYYTTYAVGDIVEKPTTLDKNLLRVPAVLERKGCASFSLTLEEDKESHVSGEHSPEDYCTTDHGLFDLIDCMARGIHRARGLFPLLRLTIFNRIDVSALSDPLNGIHIGSNGYLATEVIKIRSSFGPWQEVGSTKDVSELEWSSRKAKELPEDRCFVVDYDEVIWKVRVDGVKNPVTREEGLNYKLPEVSSGSDFSLS